MSAVLDTVRAVKNPLGIKDKISSVFGSKGMQFFELAPSPVGITQFDVATAAVDA